MNNVTVVKSNLFKLTCLSPFRPSVPLLSLEITMTSFTQLQFVFYYPHGRVSIDNCSIYKSFKGQGIVERLIYVLAYKKTCDL